MRIGIMGGTFDPIHIGHLLLGEFAYEQFYLDEVWFLPNGNPPHKEVEDTEKALAHRVEMVRLAVRENPHFQLSLHEAKKDCHSYTYKTLQEFHALYPENEYFFILGADSLFSIEQWKYFKEIFPSCTILAAMRDDKDSFDMQRQIQYLETNYQANIELLQAPLYGSGFCCRLYSKTAIIYQKRRGEVMTTELTAIRKKLEKKLKEERYIHTLGVMYTAASMAMRHGADVQKAMTAGLLHDCGKYCDVNEQILLCRKHHIKLSDAELEVPALIHARLGAYFAESEYGITDPEILDAITYHTTGRPAMTMIEKIVYLADYIEPGRKKIPGLAEVRTAAFDDIDTAVCMTAESTLAFLKRAGRKIDPMTEKTCQYYKNKAAISL